MSDTARTPATAQLPAERFEQMFPTLTPAQIGRVAALGRARAVEAGEVLVEPGDRDVPFFVVTRGELEIVRPRIRTKERSSSPRSGPECSPARSTCCRGAARWCRIARERAGEVIELDHDRLADARPDRRGARARSSCGPSSCAAWS